MRVVAAAAGRVAGRELGDTVDALLLGLVAGGTDFRLPIGHQYPVLPGEEVVAGYAGQVVEHVQGVAPVAGRVLFVTGQALRVLGGGGGRPARSEAHLRGDRGGAVGVVGAGTVAVRAALAPGHGFLVAAEAVGAGQHRVHGGFRAEIVAVQADRGAGGGAAGIILGMEQGRSQQ